MRGLHYVRLNRVLNLTAHKLAKKQSMRKDAYLADLLNKWGGDYIVHPAAPATDDRVEVEVHIADGNWKNIQAKAKSEGRDVSAVLHELVMKEIP